MASRDPNDLAPQTRKKWERMRTICAAAGVDVFLTDVLRPPEEQQELYEQGREAPGPILTHAEAWESWHQPWEDGKALAFDLAFRPAGNPRGVTWKGPWEFVGAVGEFVGLEWGGRWSSFPDRPHFQDSRGMTLAELRRETGHEPGALT